MFDPNRQDEFLDLYREALNQAVERVNQRLYMNNVVPLPEMFPHGPQDLAFLIYMKGCEMMGEVADSNLRSARNKALTVINYAAFFVALTELDYPEEVFELVQLKDIPADGERTTTYDYESRHTSYDGGDSHPSDPLSTSSSRTEVPPGTQSSPTG